MGNIKKHIVENQERAESAYWDIYQNLKVKRKELKQLQDELGWLEKDFKKQTDEREYYQKLLDELNNGNL